MDRGELHKLIEEVTVQVGERLARRDGGRRRDKAHVVLLPAPAAFPDKLKSCLERRYPGGWTLADFTGAVPEALPPEQLTRERLLPLVAQAETVSLAAPPVSLLREIAAGEDASDLAYLVIRSILWGKRVELLLDFAPPRFRRNSLLGQVAEAVDTLSSMDVAVVCYAAPLERERVTLVTEEVVRAAAKRREGAVWCETGAIITPSARDALRELGLEIRYEERKEE